MQKVDKMFAVNRAMANLSKARDAYAARLAKVERERELAMAKLLRLHRRVKRAERAYARAITALSTEGCAVSVSFAQTAPTETEVALDAADLAAGPDEEEDKGDEL